MVNLLANRVAQRFLQASESEVTKYLKGSKLSVVISGMTDQAKKDGARFGMNDVRATFEAYFGDKEGSTPAQKSALSYLTSSKGSKLVAQVVQGVSQALKKSKDRVGLRDVGDAVLDYLK